MRKRAGSMVNIAPSSNSSSHFSTTCFSRPANLSPFRPSIRIRITEGNDAPDNASNA